MRISDWSSDVCSSDLPVGRVQRAAVAPHPRAEREGHQQQKADMDRPDDQAGQRRVGRRVDLKGGKGDPEGEDQRSEEHTSELQSLMRISYAVFCLKKKKTSYILTACK